LTFNPYSASLLFCISLSLANPEIIFSPLDWHFLMVTIEEERVPNSPPKVYPAEK